MIEGESTAEARAKSSLPSTRWILVGLGAIVLGTLLIYSWTLYRGYRDWHNSKAAPLFSDIEPADGATVYASDAWIRWSSPTAAKGRVLWRKAGSRRVQSADAGNGQELLAHLASLSAGSKYEYIVEAADGSQTLRSSIRTLIAKSGLAFEPVVDQTVEHDYDQSVKLTLRNRGSVPVTVAAKALKQFDDLLSDITGYGSVDVPGQVAPNGTLDLRLAVTAADATHDTYEIPVEAAGAYVTARFHVRMPKVNLALSVSGEDPHTLAKTVAIQNNGDKITDLTVRVAQANQQDLELQPSVNHAQLNTGSTLIVTVKPILYLEFQSLKAEIEATAAGQTTKLPLEFTAPPGVHLIAFRSASTGVSGCSGGYCTNNPNTCSTCGGPPGNGPILSSPDNHPTGSQQSVARLIVPVTQFPKWPSSFVIREFEPVGLRFGVDTNLRPYLGNWLAAQPEGNFSTPSCDKEQHDYDAAQQDAERAEQYLERLIAQYQELEVKLSGGTATTQDMQQLKDLPEEAKRAEEAANNARAKVDLAAEALQRCRIASNMPPRCQLNNRPCEKHDTSHCLYCTEEARRLRSLYATVLYEFSKTDPNKRLDKLRLDLGRLLFYEIPNKWNKLRQDCCPCGDIGELYPSFGPYFPPQPPPDPDDKKWKYDFFSQLAEQCRQISEKLKDDAKWCLMAKDLVEKFKDLKIDISLEDVKNCLAALPGSWYYDDLAKQYDQLAKDPSSPDYRTVFIPEVPAGWVLSKAVLSEIEYIKAYTVSLERYQGARSAGDRVAAERQASAMSLYARQALQAARAAAQNGYKLDEAFADVLSQLNNELKSRGLTWNKAFEDSQRDLANGLPHDFESALLYYGNTREQITSLVDAARAMTYARFKSTVDRRTARYAFSKLIRERLKPTGQEDTWPEPPDVDGLRAMEQMAEIAAERIAQSGPFASETDTPLLRPGLRESLRRRATFTRSHRGGLAAPLVISGADYSAFAASVHTDDRMYFAWHQDNDQVVFAGFDAAGKVVSEPQVIGKGRWPRFAADGNRVAVGWNSRDGSNSTVRLDDGKQWGGEVKLGGGEAALAFAFSGPLYAATSTGLWKLNGDHFDRVQEANYSQPAIAVDKDGRPHVAWRQNGRIIYDGSDLGEGERPSTVIAADGSVSLAYISKGALVVRTAKGRQWSAADTIPTKNPSWPTLALDSNGGVRLSYVGAADYGPDALYLVRLPDKQPILMPSLAGNVTDAWFTTEFDLNRWRSNYRPHDLLLTVNDVWVKMFQNTVPEGRYLFRLNPYQVFTSSGAPVPNRVAIHSWHMNPGHYSSYSGYRIGVRTAWSEHYVFAANEEEARRSIASERINHDQPDLGIFANAMNLPIEQPKPGRMDIPVMIANLGEATSSPVRLLMLGEQDKVLGSAQVPTLKAGADTTITMPFDYDGKVPEITLRLENNHDFDSTNDSLRLRLWGPKPTGYEGPQPGVSDNLEPSGPKVPLELTVKLFNENTLPSAYRILQGFSDRMISKVINGEQFGSLPTGTYQLAVKQYPNEGQEVLFPDTLQHQAGVPQTVQFNSGIMLDSQLAAKVSQWSAADASSPERVIQWQSGQHPLMALPPGEYQVAMQWDNQRVVWPEKIEVQPGQQTVVHVRPGSLMVSGTGKETYNVYDSTGKVDLVNYRPTNSVTELLPGTYTVVVNNSQQRVDVTPGQQAVVGAGSVMVSGTGKESYNVYDSSGKVDLVNYRPTNSVTELLPGTYTVVVNNSQQRVDVTPSRQAVVRAGSLIVSGTGKESYNVYDPSGKVDLVNYRPTNSVTELLPGTYTVVVNNSQQRVDVTPSQQAVVRAGSLMVSGTGKDTYNVFDSTGKIDLVNYRAPNSATEMLPGTYTVVLNGSQQLIDVTPGQQAVARSGSLIVSGTGKEEYSVLDSTGEQTLATYRLVNAVTDLFPGTYVIKMGTRTAKASIQAGQRTTVSP